MKVDSILSNGILCRKKVVHVSIKRILLSVHWDYERMFHHELLLFDHHTINNKKYYTRLDQLKSIIHIRKKESLTTNKRSLIMKSCKILERFLRILLLSFVSTIIKLCKNFQDWRKWMFETRNEYYSSRMIYIYIYLNLFQIFPTAHTASVERDRKRQTRRTKPVLQRNIILATRTINEFPKFLKQKLG